MVGNTTAVQQLARVIYWVWILTGSVTALIAFRVLSQEDPPSYVMIAIVCPVLFLVPFLIGRAARYLLVAE